MTSRNIVDSSGWLEYAADSDRADLFAPAIEDTRNLIVSVISIYEVYKKVLRERGEKAALQATADMRSARVIDMDISLALEAGRYQLPLADSVIYATALRCDATLWTQDRDFESYPDVKYFPKG